MEIFEAAYRVAHDYRPDGAVGLARKMGKNPGTFLNKLNANQETHHLTLGEAVQMSTVSGDPRILDAFAETMARITLPRPPDAFPSDLELIALLLKRDAKSGDFARTLDRALLDGSISREEARSIRHQGMRYIAAISEIVVRIEGIAND